jgi:hypothetical protein
MSDQAGGIRRIVEDAAGELPQIAADAVARTKLDELGGRRVLAAAGGRQDDAAGADAQHLDRLRLDAVGERFGDAGEDGVVVAAERAVPAAPATRDGGRRVEIGDRGIGRGVDGLGQRRDRRRRLWTLERKNTALWS